MTMTFLQSVPNEIWCIIFSYLDNKSWKSASLTCKYWLEVIRNDPKFSGHIVLKKSDLVDFQTKIENSEWIWERWPVLKTLELGQESPEFEPQSAQEAIDAVKTINFENCPTLENVIFSVDFDLADFSQQYNSTEDMEYFLSSEYLLNTGTVEKLSFNPKDDLKSFGVEHIFWMQISLRRTNMTQHSDFVYNTLSLIGQNARNLVNITILIHANISTDLDGLESGFGLMFKGLNCSLQTVNLNNMNILAYGNTILNALSNNCPNLTNLNIYPNHDLFPDSELPNLEKHFSNLEELIVPKFKHIDCLVQSCDKLKDLCIERVSIVELKNCNVTEIVQRFKNLNKFQIFVIARSSEDFNKSNEWKETLEKKVQDVIELNIVNQGLFQVVG